MKTKIYLFLITTLLISGCSQSNFYQLYKTKSSNLQTKDEGLLFENEDVKVIFDLWSNKGNSSFILYNKTNKDIFIDLKGSHLIVNGMAKTYFQNRSFSESTSSSISSGSYYSSSFLKGISNTLTNISILDDMARVNSNTDLSGSIYTSSTRSKSSASEGYSIMFKEMDIVCIPANAAKAFSGFRLRDAIFRDCNLFRFPKKRKTTTSRFDENSTPLTVRNIISYGFDLNDANSFKKIENRFWASEITNYPESEFFESKKPEFCDETADFSIDYFKFFSPDRFFIEYVKGMNEDFEH